MTVETVKLNTPISTNISNETGNSAQSPAHNAAVSIISALPTTPTNIPSSVPSNAVIVDRVQVRHQVDGDGYVVQRTAVASHPSFNAPRYWVKDSVYITPDALASLSQQYSLQNGHFYLPPENSNSLSGDMVEQAFRAANRGASLFGSQREREEVNHKPLKIFPRSASISAILDSTSLTSSSILAHTSLKKEDPQNKDVQPNPDQSTPSTDIEPGQKRATVEDYDRLIAQLTLERDAEKRVIVLHSYQGDPEGRMGGDHSEDFNSRDYGHDQNYDNGRGYYPDGFPKTDWNRDPRWQQAEWERLVGDVYRKGWQEHVDQSLSSLHDFRPFESRDEYFAAIRDAYISQGRYQEANRLENQIVQDAAKERTDHGGWCTIS